MSNIISVNELFGFFETPEEKLGNQLILGLINGIKSEKPNIPDRISNQDIDSLKDGFWYIFSLDRLLGYDTEIIRIVDMTSVRGARLRALEICGKEIQYTNKYFNMLIECIQNYTEFPTQYNYKRFKRNSSDARRLSENEMSIPLQRELIRRLEFYENITESAIYSSENCHIKEYPYHLELKNSDDKSIASTKYESRNINDSKYLYIWALEVDKNMRNMGIGTILIEKIIEYAKSKKYIGIRLNVVHDNMAAIKLYTKFGFKNIEAQRTKYSIDMYKKLRDESVSEAVSVSDYKKWIGYTNKNFYNTIGEYFKKFDNSDKKHNRIYFDLSTNPDRWELEVPDEIDDYMSWYGYPILDYNKGICRDKDGRDIKIGKLLQRLGREDLLKVYSDSKQNTLKNVDDLQVVICRHPYDVIGMSTDRGWSTCIDLKDKRYGGEHLNSLKSMILNGCLVAYLIRKSDRNINKPISRIVIKKGYSGLNPDFHVYGTNIPEFREFLVEWTEKFNETNRI